MQPTHSILKNRRGLPSPSFFRIQNSGNNIFDNAWRGRLFGSGMPNPHLFDPIDFGALMRTGVDPMTSYDKSIPIDPATYDSDAYFKNRISLDDARSVGISAACESFDENRHRLIALAHLPTEAFLYALRFQKLREEVKQGKVLPGDHFPDLHQNSLFSSLSKSLRDCIDKKREFPALSQEELAPYYHVAGLSQLGNPEWIGPCIKAFAASVLSQCWQAYEVLAVDLINEAVSNNPAKFTAVTTPIKVFGFYEKSGIRAKYQKIFGPSAIDIIASIADEHLDYVYAIRNLFAHKSGKTDKHYLDKIEKLTLLKIKKPKIGEDFPLDGAMTNELGGHCFAMGYSLLREVYRWLRK